MKKLMVVAAAILLIVVLAAPAALAADINVTVDGEAVVWSDAKPFIDENNRTMVPLAAVAEALGLDVEWKAAMRQAVFSRDSAADLAITNNKTDSQYICKEMVTFTINNTIAKHDQFLYAEDGTYYEDNEKIYMDTAAVIANDRTYAPVRYLAEAFGFTVTWNSATATVEITSTEDNTAEEMFYFYYYYLLGGSKK